MLEIKPQIEGTSIVLLGSFNPKIFQPSWLASEGLVPKEEADSSEISVIHPEISVFSINKIDYQINRDQFLVSTSFQPSFKILKDLVIGIFDLLHFTPIHALGMNRDFHFPMSSEKDWHSFGDKLAPKEIWSDILKKPGTRTLVMEGQRPDECTGFIRVKAEPSIKVKYGIFININDHYQLQDPQSEKGCDEIVHILKDNWENSMSCSEEIAQKLLLAK